MNGREIKFRVWSKVLEEIIYGLYEPKEIYIRLDGELRGNFKACGDVNCDNEYVLQQYTGLKDKNGKEIYEGDIVKFISGCYHNNICEIKWNNHLSGFDVFCGMIESPNNVEIVGNIFENPDLLKIN